MGHGVVQLCASSGYNVVAVDMSQDACDKALSHIQQSLTQLSSKAVSKGKMEQAEADASVTETLGRIRTSTDVNDVAEADLIIEAIAENLPIKQKFFKQLGEIAKQDAIIATNTSSFSVQDMAEACGRPSHTVGLHYFNPVQLMQLVEIVQTDQVSSDVIDTAVAFVENTKKVAVKCKDTPGFIVNRLLIPYLMQVGSFGGSSWSVGRISQADGKPSTATLFCSICRDHCCVVQTFQRFTDCIMHARPHIRLPVARLIEW